MTAQDIITRTTEALEAASARARARDAEILRQRDAALRARPLPHTPGLHDALAKPAADFGDLERQMAGRVAAAQLAAAAKTQVSEEQALSDWQAADADAYTTYARAVDDARSGYIATIDTLQNAIHTVNAAEEARFIRDRAMAAAEAEYRSAKSADYDAYVKASAAAREQQIQTIERARQEADAGRRAAVDARDADMAVTAEAIGAAGADGAIAAAIADAFAEQLARSRADAEREKTDILARMRADLAALVQPI